MSEKIDFSARARDEDTRLGGWEQKLAKDIRKPQKIFYHPHVYEKNVGRCNFLCLFSCSLTHYLMFPCSLRFLLLCSRVPIAKFPVFPCSPKTPGGPSSMIIPRRLLFATFSISALSVFTSSFPESWTTRFRRRFPVANKPFGFCIHFFFSGPSLYFTGRSGVKV